MEAYLGRFFPHALTSERKGEIISFKQKEDESLFNALERFKQRLRRCTMHGIEKMTDECKTHLCFEFISHAILVILYPYSFKTHKISSKLGFAGFLMESK